MKKYLLISLLLCFYDSLQAQNWQFVKNYTYGQKAFGTGIGSDSIGNIYVTGHTENNNGGDYHNLIWKFDSSGNFLWVKTTDVGGKSVTDQSGNTYISGGAKYDSSGQKLWQIPYFASYFDIAIFPTGGVIMSGAKLIGNDTKSVLARYDENGDTIWTRIGDFNAGGSIPPAIDCDGSGTIYWVRNGFLAKVDSSGNLISNMTIPYQPFDVKATKDSSVYVLGYNILIKYNSNGEVSWSKAMAGSFGNKNINADDKGNIYLAIAKSSLSIDTINITGVGLFIAKIDSTGHIEWHAKSNYITGGSYVRLYLGDILVKAENEVLVAGGIDGVFQFGKFYSTLNYSTYDLFVAKISDQPVSLLSTAFTADKFQVCSSDTIQFSDSSIGNPTGWQWFFEGGSPSFSSDQNPAVTYDQPGTYFVKLVANDSIKSDSLIKNNYITVNTLPIVDLGEDTLLPAGSSFILDPLNNGGSFIWNNADTSQSITVNSSGNYSVTVTAQNGCSSADDINVLFNVSANFSANKIQVCPGDSVSFIDSSLGNISTWYWFFEGGTPTTSSAQNPTVIYSQPGTYFVKLTVNDSTSSDSVLITSYISVFPHPMVNLGPDTILESGTSIILDAENSGSQYYWSTGDTNQAITVSASANYSVSVTNQNGCAATDDIFVEVDSSSTTTRSAELLAHSSFNIYPNPATGGITINYYSQEPAELMIRVRDFSGQAKGTYFIEMVNGNESRIEKIIIE